MDPWADYYRKVFGFTQLVSFDDKDISTEFTALRSKVMSDDERRDKFPINEPAEGKKRSQIEEYLDFWKKTPTCNLHVRDRDRRHHHDRSGRSRANGVAVSSEAPTVLLRCACRTRVGEIGEAIDELQHLGILVDRDDLGYMLQIFTKPLQDRPTLFFEIIQRKGSLSFGRGNFKALFVAIEEEQAKRGTL